MKIIIAYPPFAGIKGTPLLSQNRQYQVFSEQTVIYPVIPAQAATLLRQGGHGVVWLDAIAEGISYEQFIEIIQKEKADVIAFETKTPVLKQHWRIIDDIKARLGANTHTQIVLFGDHVTAMPEESFANCKVDFILTGGDYDFLLFNLCNYLEQQRKVHNTTRVSLEPGIYYRDKEKIKNTGPFQLDHDLSVLPFIDRQLTRWWLYAYKNGNYRRVPGSYIMSGRDCWFHKCTFCSWRTLYTNYRVRRVESVINEIGSLIHDYNVKTIFDDTGTFPIGEWLKSFCSQMIENGYHRKIDFSCNARFKSLDIDDFKLMKEAGFRMLLFGVESANQNTLDRLNKGTKVEDIIQGCKLAREAGLYPHITIMFGYPWESYADALKTLRLGRWLLNKGYASTMQATMVIPYPGTELFEECKKNDWLKSLDWNDYDMKQPVMQGAIPDDKIKELVQGMYRISFSPEFILRKLFSLKDMDDLRYSLRASRKVFGHIFDFGQARKCQG